MKQESQQDILAADALSLVLSGAIASTSELTSVTKDSLVELLNAAFATNDWKLCAKISAQLARFDIDRAAEELETKQKALVVITAKIKEAIEMALAPLVEDEEFASAEGVWYSWDFGDKLTSIRVLKGSAKAPKTSSERQGGGKKFDATTDSLLAQFGDEEMPMKEGASFNTVYEDAKGYGNKRYEVRKALLKRAGILA
tara:strand:+ start:17933 stop:18529 length:597 start_codon:yes stop_codon:yes gene_type:complete